MKKFVYIIILFACGLSGCTCNSTFNNREGDKRDAEKITDNFYALLHFNQFQQIKPLFSDTFYAVVDTNELAQYIQRSDETFGTIVTDSLVKCEAMVVRGTNAKAEYLVTYYVTRTKKNTTETFYLRGEPDGIKIVKYNISYDMALDDSK